MKMTIVKPLKKNDPDTTWGVFRFNVLEDIVDDLFRYGIKTAFHNLIYYIRHR